MKNQGPLVVVDDDADDQELIKVALKDIGFNDEVRMFNNAEAALEFLYTSTDQPFLIVSDINMPKMNGINFKKHIDGCSVLKSKCIPFIFLSTSTKFIEQTCDLTIQGYFEKGNSLEDLHETMKIICKYWQHTKHTQHSQK
jgi:two-component SAPR family response regulator